ncbi:MAG: hypothetical protein ACFB4I_18860 [Cyanophyceae cyanobacterium]
MSIWPNLLRSLLLTALLSFAAPTILVGGALATLSLVSCVPGFTASGQAGANQILDFLSVFGSGNSVEGMMTIGLTCSSVGLLFDLFNFYCYQNLKG